MKLELDCMICNINQVIKMAKQFKLNKTDQEKMMKEVLGYLSDADYSKCNPAITADTWEIIVKHVGDSNPYKEIKRFYNDEMMKMADIVKEKMCQSKDPFVTGLKIAITGNLIDFAAKHSFNVDMVKDRIMNVDDIHLEIDDSGRLYNNMKHAKSLLYLGDNCGEIVMDKFFIEYLREEFPKLDIYFAVRGKSVLNDITWEDAEEVAMKEVAKIVDNGDNSPGTVIDRTSDEFKELYYDADVVIAKGQGNYESLSETDRKNVFHLFMAKCDIVAKSAGTEIMSIVCIENNGVERK
ncbi:MAG: ARMT1-like domain-containing protein [Bacillota bacterium]|nr:ARMT1-like domain-containing protein [Bacillota bacterium]